MGHKLNVGLIGAGRIGKVHGETIAFRVPEAALIAVADPNLDAAELLAARFGVPEVKSASGTGDAIESTMAEGGLRAHRCLPLRSRSVRPSNAGGPQRVRRFA